MVIAKTGAKRMLSIISNQREWLSVLVYVNAARRVIPSFYIFQGKRFRQNYIQHCKVGATMAMQRRAWMTAYLFIAAIQRTTRILPTQRHLLILDRHNSHITLEVARAAKSIGIDLINLPSHTSYALQSLDVSVFKPFKQFFREYRDFWMSKHVNQSTNKECLAQWVSLSLWKSNIISLNSLSLNPTFEVGLVLHVFIHWTTMQLISTCSHQRLSVGGLEGKI
jgi:hypothetical protein